MEALNTVSETPKDISETTLSSGQKSQNFRKEQ